VAEVFPRDILFYGGGLALARFGALAARLNVPSRGGEEGLETVTRADAATCATAVDRDGRVRGYAAHHARIEWRDTDGDGILDTPGLVSEFGCTPAWDRADELDHANWTKINVTVTPNDFASPRGLTEADKILETATTAHHGFLRATGALTDNRRQLSHFYLRGGLGRDWVRILTNDKSNTNRNSWIDITNRVLGTVNSGHKIRIEKLGNLWMYVEVSWDAATGATAPELDIVSATADANGSTFLGDVTKGFYAWRVQHIVDRGVGQTSITPGAAGAVQTRSDEAILAPVPFAPQDLTVLFDHARNVADDLAGVSLNAVEGRGIFDLGDAGANHVWCYHDFGSTRQILAGVRGATTDAAVVRGTPAGDRIRGIVQVRNFATAPSVALDVGAGLSAFSGVTESFQKWQNQRIRLGGIVNSNLRLCAPLYRVVVARGLRSFAEMVAIP
jgi:hypothetical protein